MLYRSESLLAMAQLSCIIFYIVWLFPALSIGSQVGLPMRNEAIKACGLTRVMKIVGGTAASEYYPWFVALVKPESVRGDQYLVACGATLITPKHIVTAAHCYGNKPDKDFLTVVINLVDRCTKGGDILKVHDVEGHPGFNMESPIPEYDIALIYLKDEVLNTPICLPTRSRYTGKRGIIIGFGSTRMRSTYPCQMQYSEVEVMSRKNCTKKSNLQIPLADKTICAGVMSGGIDACDGDSGGPLMVNNQGHYELIGVVSYGDGCGRVKTPGVYTDITKRGYYDWIQERLGDYKQDGVIEDVPGKEENTQKPNQPSQSSTSKPTSASYQIPSSSVYEDGFPFHFLSPEDMHKLFMARVQAIQQAMANNLPFW